MNSSILCQQTLQNQIPSCSQETDLQVCAVYSQVLYVQVFVQERRCKLPSTLGRRELFLLDGVLHVFPELQPESQVARILPLAAPGFFTVSHERPEVLVDPDDGEAVATAMVLSSFLQPKMLAYGLPFPLVLQKGSEVRAEMRPKSSWALHKKLICLCAHESR